MRYEFAVIGAGVAGIFAAREWAERGYKVLMIDKGKKLDERSCPLDRGESCDCDACDKYVGFGGLGLSEGKYNYTNDFGGDLERKVGYGRALELMDEVDAVLCEHGGGRVQLYDTRDPEMAERAEKAGFGVLTTRTRHLGSELSRSVLHKMYEEMESRIDWRFRSEVREMRRLASGGFELTLADGETVQAGTVVIATGRSGSEWLTRQCRVLGIDRGEARVDLGLRIEMRGDQLRSILGRSFETKLRFAGNGYSATTYCMNPSGRVILKHQEGLAMPDGQNYREREEGGSPNLNFTLFVPSYFRSPEEADRYLRDVVGGVNRGRARIAAQRLGELRRRRSSSRTASVSALRAVVPTLDAELADLRLEVPETYIRATLEFLDALEKLLGEPIDEDTILYAIDGKLYSPGIETDGRFETRIPRLFVIGDCSGTTHSLSQAAASGLYVGRELAAE
ncbi:NAD(P)/FAD-dependent oxidoreductase [Cohnella zeiphila]|uniref:NAD(P)/FAD-dependent oxidoreductase n=1 Tax=Cohnella zeiphila TaxID=2761120 RepID=A0A7X0W007_9BACL|nr:NAD(P)/FAD-dependent oxidoreductase [Cohnella zeiphila]MBB6734528.1 NAD(P)/FAD-dependent oxidoreductase [Cohnella zeiphila]